MVICTRLGVHGRGGRSCGKRGMSIFMLALSGPVIDIMRPNGGGLFCMPQDDLYKQRLRVHSYNAYRFGQWNSCQGRLGAFRVHHTAVHSGRWQVPWAPFPEGSRSSSCPVGTNGVREVVQEDSRLCLNLCNTVLLVMSRS